MKRRIFAEFVGTFCIVFCPVALAAVHGFSSADSGLFASALVSGLSVLAMIYSVGPISAAHFNPAVTLGFAVARRFPWRFVFHYWLAQFGGALAATLLANLFFAPGHGTHVPSGPAVQSIAVELVITFFLMFVIMAVATDRRVNAAVPGLAIGLTVVLGILIGGPISGGSMNPARSFGPALFAGGKPLFHYWIYVVGPCCGAILAARCYEWLRGNEEHAQGAPNELWLALQRIKEESQVISHPPAPVQNNETLSSPTP